MFRASRVALSQRIKETGKVLNWLDNDGFGIIERADGSQLRAHQMAINMRGYRSLAPGQTVEFNVEKDYHGGDRAVDVTAPGGFPPKPYAFRDFSRGSPQTALVREAW